MANMGEGLGCSGDGLYMDSGDYISSSDVRLMMDLVVNDVMGRHSQMVSSICQDPAWSREDIVSELRLEFLRVVPLVRDGLGVRNQRGYRYRFYYTCVLNQLRRLYNRSKRRNLRDGGSLEELRDMYGDLMPELRVVEVEDILDEVAVLRSLMGGLLARLREAERVLGGHGLLGEYHKALMVCCGGGDCVDCVEYGGFEELGESVGGDG